jgi:hypothetical protein
MVQEVVVADQSIVVLQGQVELVCAYCGRAYVFRREHGHCTYHGYWIDGLTVVRLESRFLKMSSRGSQNGCGKSCTGPFRWGTNRRQAKHIVLPIDNFFPA